MGFGHRLSFLARCQSKASYQITEVRMVKRCNKSTHKAYLYVYFLRDPFTGIVRYIGSSANPENRAKEHFGSKCALSTPEARQWMLSLKKTKPILSVVTPLIPRSEALTIERRLMTCFHRNYPGQIVNGLSVVRKDRLPNIILKQIHPWWTAVPANERMHVALLADGSPFPDCRTYWYAE